MNGPLTKNKSFEIKTYSIRCKNIKIVHEFNISSLKKKKKSTKYFPSNVRKNQNQKSINDNLENNPFKRRYRTISTKIKKNPKLLIYDEIKKSNNPLSTINDTRSWLSINISSISHRRLKPARLFSRKRTIHVQDASRTFRGNVHPRSLHFRLTFRPRHGWETNVHVNPSPSKTFSLSHTTCRSTGIGRLPRKYNTSL